MSSKGTQKTEQKANQGFLLSNSLKRALCDISESNDITLLPLNRTFGKISASDDSHHTCSTLSRHEIDSATADQPIARI